MGRRDEKRGSPQKRDSNKSIQTKMPRVQTRSSEHRSSEHLQINISKVLAPINLPPTITRLFTPLEGQRVVNELSRTHSVILDALTKFVCERTSPASVVKLIRVYKPNEACEQVPPPPPNTRARYIAVIPTLPTTTSVEDTSGEADAPTTTADAAVEATVVAAAAAEITATATTPAREVINFNFGGGMIQHTEIVPSNRLIHIHNALVFPLLEISWNARLRGVVSSSSSRTRPPMTISKTSDRRAVVVIDVGESS